MAELSQAARVMLHFLIHGDEEWWKSVHDGGTRLKAMDELVRHKLVEVRLGDRMCRATKRGQFSNAKLLETGWTPPEMD